jgi:hypothetical protein
MKKYFFGLVATVMISANSFAINPTVKHTVLVKSFENKTKTVKALPKSDWAGFVCWLFGGHCQPV